MGPIGFSGALSLLSWASRPVAGATSPARVPFRFGRLPSSRPGTFYGRLALSRISRRPVAARGRERAGPGDFETPEKLEETKKKNGGKKISKEGKKSGQTFTVFDVPFDAKLARWEINSATLGHVRGLARYSVRPPPSYEGFRRYNPSLSPPPFVGNKKPFCKTLIIIFKSNTDKRRINNEINASGGHESSGKRQLEVRNSLYH